MKDYRLPLIALALAVLLGWWIAPPALVTSGNDASGPSNLLEAIASPNNTKLADHLQTLYQREVWSSRKPDGTAEQSAQDGTANAEDAPPLPEGLDRFRLLGVIRVGSQVDALLIDDGLAQDAPTSGSAGALSRVFRATPGEQLNNSGVTLDQIDTRRARLVLGDETRWIALYPDYRGFANDTND